jgi:hypothetical protein
LISSLRLRIIVNLGKAGFVSLLGLAVRKIINLGALLLDDGGGGGGGGGFAETLGRFNITNLGLGTDISKFQSFKVSTERL